MDQPIGERVRSLREAQKLSRADLGKAVGLSATAISDIELGRTKSTTKIDLLAKVLHTTPEYLRTGRGDPHPSVVGVREPSTQYGFSDLARQVAFAWMDADPVTQANICTLLRIEPKPIPPTLSPTRRTAAPFIKPVK